MKYAFKTAPFRHQLDEFNLSRSLPDRALFWEPGVGKTKPLIDTAASLYGAREIDGLLVVAPDGVHHNWVAEEIPAHMPDAVMAETQCFLWQTQKAAQVGYRSRLAEFEQRDGGLSALFMSFNGLMTEAGRKAAKKFLKRHRCMYVVDEAHNIKSPGAKTTKRSLASGEYAPFRRVATGTLIDSDPFDAYAQIKFVRPHAWISLGITTFEDFKTYFGVWETKTRKDGKEYPELQSFKNLDQLKSIIASCGSRLLKKDVLDLPPKLYSKFTFDLSPKQRRLYDELETQYCTEIGGRMVWAELGIVRLLRLQQVCSGYLPVGREEPVALIDEVTPRIRALREIIEGASGKVIIWAKFNMDVDLITAMLRREGLSHVQYDGRTSEDDRILAKAEFQRGDARFFVGKPSACGSGITLHAASTVIFFNTDFKLGKRLQAEDRAHRIGLQHPVYYIDIMANDSVDDHIVGSLRQKRLVARELMGDTSEEWI